MDKIKNLVNIPESLKDITPIGILLIGFGIFCETLVKLSTVEQNGTVPDATDNIDEIVKGA